MKKSFNIRHFRRIITTIAVASLTLVTFQNCGSKDSATGPVDFVEAGETAVAPIKIDKTDRILHSRSTANAIVHGLGLTNSANRVSLVNGAVSIQLLLSESGAHDTITGGQITVHMNNLAESGCESLIFDQERGLLSIASGVVDDNRRFFRGIYLGDQASKDTLYDPATFEIKDTTYYPPYSDKARYREAIQRLALTLWKRNSLAAEEDLILNIVAPVLADGSSLNRGYRASVMICTVMTSSYDFMRQ